MEGEAQQEKLAYEFPSIAPGEKFEDEDGTIAIDYFAIAYGAIPPEEIDQYSLQLSADYFDEHLKAMSARETVDRFPSEGERQLSFHGAFPTIKFNFATDLREEVKVLGYNLLDPILKRSLSDGDSWGVTDDQQFMEANLQTCMPPVNPERCHST